MDLRLVLEAAGKVKKHETGCRGARHPVEEPVDDGY
jgi:hypothetical protein